MLLPAEETLKATILERRHFLRIIRAIKCSESDASAHLLIVQGQTL